MEDQEIKIEKKRFSAYSSSEREEIINFYEECRSFREVQRRYKVDRKTLVTWLEEKESTIYFSKKRKLFTEAERIKIAREIHNGAITTEAAMVKYGIKDKGRIRRWLKLLAEISVINPIENSEMQAEMDTLPNNIQVLKETLAKANFKIKALETMIDVAEDQLRVEIRKKPGARQLKG